MTFLSVSLIALALLHADTAPADGTVQFSYWAAQATSENREKPLFDQQLTEIQKAVAELPFDTYRTVKTGNATLSLSKDQEFKLDGQYQLHAKPVEKDSHGRIKVDLRIMELEPPKKPKTALASSAVMQPDKMVKMRGLKLRAGGELVLVIRVR